MSSESDAFAGYMFEDVMFCNVDNLGGVSTEIFYCFLPFVQTMRLPLRIGTNKNTGTITLLKCFENRGFHKITAQLETPLLESNYKPGNAPDTSELTMYLPGTRAELIGLSRKLRDKPFSFIVKDYSDKKFIIGTLESPAYLKSFKISPGKKMEDDNGAELKFRSNAICYEFNGNIPLAPTDISGDFDTDFDEDFN